jgi:chemotaxis protein methyltransferase CheR
MSEDIAHPSVLVSVPSPITRDELEGFRRILYNEVGITLSEAKQTMVSARLSKRLRSLGIKSYGEYLQFLQSKEGQELEFDHFIDAMTTNKTEFFRERNHFDILSGSLLPEIRRGMARGEPFLIWSAGCSTGEEPYSLAMLLYDHFLCVPETFSVLATDISTRALERARKAVYSKEIVESVPKQFMDRFLLRGKGRQQGSFRVAPEIRTKVVFDRLNLMDDVLSIDGPAHVIWCRNVMIYFDTQTKVELCRKLHRLLAPGGYLFIGHSESLQTISDEFEPYAPAVYHKPRGGRSWAVA